VLSDRPLAFTVFGQLDLRVRDEAGDDLEEDPVQIAATRPSANLPRPIAPGTAQAQSAPADLTQLAVAQTNAKMTASAGAALAQVTGELTGTLVNISV
jgi:hypothetical protein